MDGLLGLAGMMTLHIITIVMKFGSFPKIPFSFFRTSKSFPSILRLFFRGVWLPIVLPEPVFFLTSLAHRRVSLRRAGITSLLGPVDHRCLVDGVHGYPHDFGKRPLWYFKCVFQFWSFYIYIYIYLSIYLWSYCWIPQIIRIWRYFMIFQYWPHGDLGRAPRLRKRPY